MAQLLRRFVSPTVLIAVLALLVVVSVPAWAALITGADIKNNTVTTKDIRNKTIKPADMKPVNGVVAVPFTSFFPASAGGYGGLGGVITPGRFLTGVGGNGGNRLFATVTVPHGAQITSVRLDYWDDLPATPSFRLWRFGPGSTSVTFAEFEDPDVDEAAVQSVTMPVDASMARVNNHKYVYVLQMFMLNWTTSDVQIIAGRVNYRL
jgi:hypothetical protein